MNNEELMQQAAERIEAERHRSIAVASAAVAVSGTEICLDCGATIPPERRLVAPWAKRCIECQEFFEAERLAK